MAIALRIAAFLGVSYLVVVFRAWRLQDALAFRPPRTVVFAADYRGYGENPGTHLVAIDGAGHEETFIRGGAAYRDSLHVFLAEAFTTHAP